MHTTEATYAIKQVGRGTEAVFYYGLQGYSPSRTRASAPRPTIVSKAIHSPP